MSKFTVVTRSEPPCPHCRRAKSFLDRKGIEYEELDILDHEIYVTTLLLEHNWKSFPMVLDEEGELVGGADDLIKKYT